MPGLPHDIETICLKCLQKEPAKRYANAAALEEDLRRYQAGEPILARRISGAERAWRWCRRNPAMAGLVATLLVVLHRRIRRDDDAVAPRRAADAVPRPRTTSARRSNAVDDYLTRVAESRLLGVPGLQPLRKELLESALPYYESFVRQRAEDPALAHELASACGRLAKINAELGRRPEAIQGLPEGPRDPLARERPLRQRRLPTARPSWRATTRPSATCIARPGTARTALQSYQAAEAIWRKLTWVGRGGSPGSPGGDPA